MKFTQLAEPHLEKPLVIAALQDMGNVGSIVIDFVNKAIKSSPFRTVEATQPSYVIDNGGHIEVPRQVWEYRHSKDIIVFGGGTGQPSSNEELHLLCRDVIDVAKKYEAKFIYTLGGFHTPRPILGDPKTFVTTTSQDLMAQLQKMGISMTPARSVITGFNGLILGYAKMSGMHGIGLYGELDEPEIPQYKTAKSVVKTLEKMTYHNFGSTAELDALADDVDRKMNSGRDFDL